MRTKNPSVGVDGIPIPSKVHSGPSCNSPPPASSLRLEEENEERIDSEEERTDYESISDDNEGSEGEERIGSESEEEKNGSKEDKGKRVEEKEDEEATESLAPEMYFRSSEYQKKLKLQSRCYLKKAVDTITGVLQGNEIRWFHEHPQFIHFFHMRLESNHKFQGMWMLFLHAARTLKKREAWFVLNGVPMRYSIREHGLLSGLYCHNYPLEWDRLGSLDFVRRHFARGSTITYEAVEHKFLMMNRCRDRLNMAVLYFLSSVIVGQTKKGAKTTGKGAKNVEPFFLRAVNDLELCRSFPWGRFSFDDNLKRMSALFAKFDGVVTRDQWVYPSFSIPLEMLAFESIPVLRSKYREYDTSASSECPRMCTSRFKKHSVSGFALEDLYEALGKTKDIPSVLVPLIGERTLCGQIFDEAEDDQDVDDFMVQSWKNRFFKERKRVFIPSLFARDVHAQMAAIEEVAQVEGAEEEGAEKEVDNLEEESHAGSNDEVKELKKNVLDLQEGMVKMNKCMEDGFEKLFNLIGGHDARLKEIESFIKLQTSNASLFEGGTTSREGGTTEGDGGTTGGEGGTTEGEADEDREEEGEKDDVVGEKRKRKPSDAKKSPYTSMTEEKKKKKAESKRE